MKDSESEVKLLYNSLLKDEDFDRLSLELRKPNFFEILGVAHAELKHSNILSWLLDPKGNHSLGDLFLKRLLREILLNDNIEGLDQFFIESIDTNSLVVKREWRNIDILIFNDEFVVCIENKVFSKDHDGQLTKYKTIITDNFKNHKKIFVYLTPFGELPKEEYDLYITLSYQSVIDIIDRLLSVFSDTMNTAVNIYLQDYKVILKRYLMNTDHLADLAKKIYNNHQDLFEFVYSNKPDIAEDFRKFFENKVIESGWKLGSPNKGSVRFYTQLIDCLIPRYQKSNGWPNREGFLFEIDYFWSSKKKMVFKAIIAPGNEKYANTLSSILSKIDGSINAAGKKYIVHFISSATFDLEKLKDKTDTEIMDVIDKFWPQIADIVTKVEAAMIENKEQIVNSLNE